ncbi:MAG: hypothetical protein AAF495_09275 [Pseudomonadota bacterium]
MLVKLTSLLEPGERVICEVRPSGGRTLRDVLQLVPLLAALCGGLELFAWLIEPDWRGLGVAATIGSGLPMAYLIVARGEALLTERRYLRRRGLIRPKVTEIPLTQVREVVGLEPCSTRGVALKKYDNWLEDLSDLPDARRFGLEIAAAAGLPLPEDPPSPAMRAHGLLASAGLIGGFTGFALVFVGLCTIGMTSDSQLVMVLTIFAVVGMLVPLLGGVSGWLVGLVGALVYLRRRVSAQDLRAAIHMNLYPGEDPLFTNGYTPWGRRILAWLAGRLTGQPMGPPDAPKET